MQEIIPETETKYTAEIPYKLSITIPCWDEKETIKEILDKVSKLKIKNWQIEIIVVDDYSTDGTRDILKNYENIYKIIYHDRNQGKGSSVKTGILNATGDYIVIQDADLEYNPDEIVKLVEALALDNQKNVVVYGSRNINSTGRKMMLIPRLGVWFITKEFNFLFWTKLTDIWTCYKLFPKEAGKYFDNGGFESELSFTAKLIKNGFKIIEVPISHKPRPFESGKKIKYSDGFKGIWTIVKERFYLG